MNSFDLDVEKCINWDIVTSILLDPSFKLKFVLSLNLSKLLNESWISSLRSQLGLKNLHVGDPFVNTSNIITDQLGKAWVTAMNPSALSNTVGLVLNFLTIELMEILENCFLEKIRVDCCNTINCVWANNSKVWHTHLLIVTFLNKRHACYSIPVLTVSFLEVLNVQMVYLEDEIQVSW